MAGLHEGSIARQPAASGGPACDTPRVTSPIRTLCFALRPGEVLLGLKKRGFGAGKVTGIGGKVEAGETVQEAALRELREEVHLDGEPSALRLAAVIDFQFPNRPAWGMPVHVFTLSAWTGCATETEEIAPVWTAQDGLPYAQMWDDARYWLPAALRGARARWTFVFGADNARVQRVRRVALGAAD